MRLLLDTHVLPWALEGKRRPGPTAGFDALPVSWAAALAGGPPPHHRDPFDRPLLTQGTEGALRPLSADAGLPTYGAVVMPLPA